MRQTETLPADGTDRLLELTRAYEAGGWAVHQIIPTALGFVVVFEREKTP